MTEPATRIESDELCINANERKWVPTGEGAWIKVLRVSPETGNWVALFKQLAGTCAPPHKHLGAAEFYVLEGCIEYRGGKAEAGYYGYEPLGAVHEKTSFPVDTIYILTSYGPLAMRDENGKLIGVMDSEMMHGLLSA
jgi:anti-sigma factor ChrR (cupin superfamily)